MRIEIQFNEEDKVEAMKQYLIAKNLVPEGYKIEKIYYALGEAVLREVKKDD